MNNIIITLLQMSLSLAVLFVIYYAFLQKDTFFKTNRMFLILSIMASMVIPLVDWGFLMNGGQQAFMVFLDPIVITPDGIQQSIENNSNVYQILLAIYLTGVFIFSVRFAFQLFQLIRLIYKFGISKQDGMRLVFTSQEYTPFSFFNLIFINNKNIHSPEVQKILAHENVHIRQWHSLDLILIELVTIVLWFNPFIWFYRHAVKTLHEYLADEGVLHSGVDVNVYSTLLFEQGTGIQINDLTNNFSKSLIKKRIIMMTKKKTAQMARAKLMIALPLALSMMLLISFSTDMLAQDKEAPPPPPPPKKEKEVKKPAKSDKEPVIVTVVERPGGQDDDPVFTVVEEMPEYPGGKKALYAFMGENIKYPEDAKKKGTAGTVFVTFVIEKDGKVSGVKLLRGVSESLDKEALRVVSSMPAWKPGKQKGKAVRVQYNLPIKFSLNNDEDKKKQEEKKKIEAEKK
jgi:TonB family protein